jgi:glycosyltransferase involved in cell wall biosynthesis
VEKNVSFLREVLCRCPDITLAIVGDGPYRASLEHQFAGLDVNFMGYFQGQDLVEAYATADAFIYASETETMGNVVLEAMASGQCVIAPHALGVRSLIEHNVNGLLYEPRNAAAALACVSQAFDDEAVRQSLKQRAREYAVEHTWCRSAGQVRETYLSCIAQSAVEKRSRKRLARVLTSGLVQSFRAGSAAKNGFKTARPNHKKPIPKTKVDQELVKS